MRLLHYIEIQNFKRFGDSQRIQLDHPAVIIGPNNCGKTSTLQALALWSQALQTWLDARRNSSATERTSVSLNRLNIVAIPVQKTRAFWHNSRIQGTDLKIEVGVEFRGKVHPLGMKFTHRGDEVVYCTPSDKSLEDMALLEHAAKLKVELLYPMSGLETEEAVLQPGRIDVLLGQGQTAQVLRNLCLMVARDTPDDWVKIVNLMKRLFQVALGNPIETARGAIDLTYKQSNVKEALDVSASGRGFQQMLLIFTYLYSHKRSVLLVDEPDAHLEILRQKQVYVLLRDIASENESQVVIVTHSEVILDEALDMNLTLLLDGQADDLAQKTDIRNSLKNFGASHYVKARERNYVLYVEGGTDIDMLRAFAEALDHPVLKHWDERINSFYVQNNFPSETTDSELERVEGGFGVSPLKHFNGLRELLPELKGLAVLDNDGRGRTKKNYGALEILYWKRYEAENYFVTPDLLKRYAASNYSDMELFTQHSNEVESVLEELIKSDVFEGSSRDYDTWKGSPTEAARVIWEAKTSQIKLSKFAEDFFRKLAEKIGQQMLLTKGELHRLVPLKSPDSFSNEVHEKLNALDALFRSAEGSSEE